MPAKISLIGKQFGSLKVIEDSPTRRTKRGRTKLTYKCSCQCGREVVVCANELRNGQKSCGCLWHPKKHGHACRSGHHPLYQVWCKMVARCEKPNHKEWKNYGARGIRVCQRWLEFSCFLADMGYPPAGHSIERRDNNAGYSPENCYWATPAQQAVNRRTNRVFTIRGVTGCVTVLAKHFGINPHSVITRINSYGWTPEEAFTSPLHKHIRKQRLRSQASAPSQIIQCSASGQIPPL